LVLASVAIAFSISWLPLVMAIGFALRVMSGPRFSPLALLMTKVVRPLVPVEPRWVAGPPKRFAQTVGFAFTTVASVLWLAFGLEGPATVVLALLVVAASLEAFVGLCLGCRMFAVGMRLGLVPEPVCERCASIGSV
jgi:hypothetical protein